MSFLKTLQEAKANGQSLEDVIGIGTMQGATSTSKAGGNQRPLTDMFRDGGVISNALSPLVGEGSPLRYPAEMLGDQARGAVKGATFGSAATMGALGDELVTRMQGVDNVPLPARIDMANEEYNEQSGLLGEIAGSMLGAPRVAVEGATRMIGKNQTVGKKLRAAGLGGVFARRTADAGFAGVETLVYSLAEGASFDQALSNAGIGAAFGGTAGGIIDIGKVTASALARRMGTLPADEITDTVIENMRKAYGDNAVDAMMQDGRLQAEAMTAASQTIEGSMPDNMLSMFPQALVKEANRALREADLQDTAAMKSAMRPLHDYTVSMNRAAQEEFREAMNYAVGNTVVRKPDELVFDADSIQRELQPMYDKVFENAGDKAIPVPAIFAAMDGAFGDTSFAQDAELLKGLKAVYGEPFEKAGKSKKDGVQYPAVPKAMTPRQLHRFRQMLDSQIFRDRVRSPIKGKDSPSIDNTTMAQKLAPLRKAVSDMLHKEVPGMEQIDNVFSTTVAVKNAYEAGRQVGKDPNRTTASIDMFAATGASRSQAEFAAFAEGLKYEFMSEMRDMAPEKAQTFARDRPETMEKIAQLVGPEAPLMIEKATEKYAAMAKIGNAADDFVAGTQKYTRRALPSLIDLATVAGALTNTVSSAAGLGAARRTAGMMGQGAKDVSQGLGQGLNDILTASPQDASRMLNKNLDERTPQTMPGLGPAIAPMMSGEDN